MTVAEARQDRRKPQARHASQARRASSKATQSQALGLSPQLHQILRQEDTKLQGE